MYITGREHVGGVVGLNTGHEVNPHGPPIVPGGTSVGLPLAVQGIGITLIAAPQCDVATRSSLHASRHSRKMDHGLQTFVATSVTVWDMALHVEAEASP